MPVQDLTPQLRTRLSRVERVVGVFVTLATLLLLAGFGYYLYRTGVRKGWWVVKAPYFTFVENAAGLHVGDVVRMLGFDVGQITKVTALPPEDIIYSDYGNVYIEFVVREPFYGYVWSDSQVRVNASDLLGNRHLEVSPGGSSYKLSTNAQPQATYKVERKEIVAILNDKTGAYEPFTEKTKGFWLPQEESPAITERLEIVANQVQSAIPAILDLTNRLNLVFSNVASLTLEAQGTLAEVRPMISNVTVITANLKDPKGSLGEWILPTNMSAQISGVLTSANVTLTNLNQTLASTDSNVTTIATGLDETLINLANITSNLNQQVQANTNLLKGVSDLVTNADDMVQGLKHHWLLRSAFKKRDKEEAREEEQNAPAERRITPPPKAGKWRD